MKRRSMVVFLTSLALLMLGSGVAQAGLLSLKPHW
jgi:hypothetical protein